VLVRLPHSPVAIQRFWKVTETLGASSTDEAAQSAPHEELTLVASVFTLTILRFIEMAVGMSDSDLPFDAEQLARLVEGHKNTSSRTKQRFIERDIVDVALGESIPQPSENEYEYDSTSVEARREVLERIG
jgi:hypothetical protein